VFEYELDNPMALYGAIPFIMAHDTVGAPSVGASAHACDLQDKTTGVFLLNSAEIFVDTFSGKDEACRGHAAVIEE
jgi:hypothetical protein